MNQDKLKDKLEKKTKISASILAADFVNLEDEIRKIENTSAHYLHLDVIDGVFAPNITFGMPIVKRISQITKIPLDVHLMICNPQNYLQQFVDCGACIITVHVEAVSHLDRVLKNIKQMNCRVGVALNPDTSLCRIENVLEYLDRILIMSVNPGFAGQLFIQNSIKKIQKCRTILDKTNNENIEIAVDGGVNIDNCRQIKNAGADVLVAGNAIFKTENYAKTINNMINGNRKK